MVNCLPLTLYERQGKSANGLCKEVKDGRTHQTCLAMSTESKTVSRQSAFEVMIDGSCGACGGRASGLILREKNELNV